jgi:hypothetical protein
MHPDQELQQLYKHIPMYSGIPNAGMKCMYNGNQEKMGETAW